MAKAGRVTGDVLSSTPEDRVPWRGALFAHTHRRRRCGSAYNAISRWQWPVLAQLAMLELIGCNELSRVGFARNAVMSDTRGSLHCKHRALGAR
jgi:hypothetical protein